MPRFIHDDFLLGNAAARRLYHQHAAGLPIIDYHCHLDPADLAADRVFANLAQVWVNTDPYKHRAMRIAGVPEHFITGPATDREKFDRWAATVPLALGNPLYHWSALELQRYFGIEALLSPRTADFIWETCNHLLATPGYSARGLIARCNVRCVCTSDRLLDDLGAHARLAASDFSTRVLPSLRSDDIVAVDQPEFDGWLQKLAGSTGIAINSLENFQQAVIQRLDFFGQSGCRLADHALDDFHYAGPMPREAPALFTRRLAGAALSAAEVIELKSALLHFLGLEYGRRNWVLQLHIGAQRRTSTRLRTLAGPAGGYSGMGRACDLASLCRFLDDLEKHELLPRTILYTLNPADSPALAVLTGSFAQDDVAGKVQLGPAWWYNDHAPGIRRHLEDLASHGLLSTFIGMTTDSRSLLSMTRHEYFRRLLCDYVGQRIESGDYPDDPVLVGELIRNLCWENAGRWLSGAP